MTRSYVKTAFRFMRKNKAFSFINIFGLSVGTLCCLYIMLYVKDQYSYDKHHVHAADIYRINNLETSITHGITYNNATVVAPVAPLLKENFPEVDQFTRVVPFLQSDEHLLRYKAKALYEKEAVYVDSTFFDVFSYHFVYGNPLTALKAPNSIVLLKTTARKLFGAEDPVGKTITMENVYFKRDLTVTAVIDESLGKSHIQANMFITMNSGFLGDYALHTDAWTRNGFIASYVKLRPDANITSLEKKFPALVNRYAGDQLKEGGEAFHLYLQPVTAIHTTTGLLRYQPTKPVSPTFLTILLLIAILIQLVACINFMNLSTARAAKRAREVVVRKVAGAGRRDLVKQFLGESFLLAFIGVLIALPLLLLLLPYLNLITQAEIGLSFLKDIQVWALLAALVIVTGFVAGSYPAFYLSTFQAIKVLKGNFTNHVSAAGIRRTLVVFQFVLSIVLITGIIVIYSQLNYIRHKDLGFDQNQQLVFSFHTEENMNGIPAFINDLRQLAGIKAVSNANVSLSGPVFFSNGFFLNGEKEAQAKAVDYVITDEHFAPASGIRIINGRNFRPTDSSKVLINETYARQLGLTAATAVGIHLYDSQSRDAEIVGVMKDFNYTSLHNDVTGFLVWKQKPVDYSWPTVIARTNTRDYKALLAQIAALWQKDVPGSPFSYSFMDDDVQRQYEAEITLSRIINSFTGMAILISCLGLFGLAAFSAEQRSKEIGVRKVLGASVAGIAQLLSKDFLKLVVIAFVIATPIAWWATRLWLQEFAYRIPVSWWMFALSGVAVLVIALLTVSFQAIKAAVANPVKSLRMD
ncbi:FtsX-like permease family protein [Chitinophaga agrisoli]|uniref:FtsX-like permease family protein n=1 Tax=Chitinophaga agrisoli TaxID=2607653 RepID=A0A5B2VKM6_9BACT|nr:ABC transporter permease [Chitinophaga agrisoli]KAA2238852.1 FtsX-like permease family protein [Chitinophaga agrisoli]